MQAYRIRQEPGPDGPEAAYAARLARRAILRRYCFGDHPVLMIEEDLVDMARARLQDHVLETGADRTASAQAVRDAAAARVLASDEEDRVKVTALTEVVSMSAEEILPAVH